MSAKKTKRFKDRKADIEMQQSIRARANYSLAVLGESFRRHGSGRYLHLNVLRPGKKARNVARM